ncbi:MAG: hypothetical protein JXO48_08170 [Deltaproteobacteria bacterium]|nr:hypothetical protein [Deltaproteobacteria bacterium]
MAERDSKLVPILRQGVAVVQMVFFKRLKDHLGDHYPGREAAFIHMLAGAIINDIFGTPNREEPFASFIIENRDIVGESLRRIPLELVDMMVPLTDALRVQVLCDGQEGIDSSSILVRANELKILLVPREIPLPARFIRMVRRLGNHYDIILPPEIGEPNSTVH